MIRRPGQGPPHETVQAVPFRPNRLGGLSRTVDGASTADGADIEQETYRQAHQQQWQIIAV